MRPPDNDSLILRELMVFIRPKFDAADVMNDSYVFQANSEQLKREKDARWRSVLSAVASYKQLTIAEELRKEESFGMAKVLSVYYSDLDDLFFCDFVKSVSSARAASINGDAARRAWLGLGNLLHERRKEPAIVFLRLFTRYNLMEVERRFLDGEPALALLQEIIDFIKFGESK